MRDCEHAVITCGAGCGLWTKSPPRLATAAAAVTLGLFFRHRSISTTSVSGETLQNRRYTSSYGGESRSLKIMSVG